MGKFKGKCIPALASTQCLRYIYILRGTVDQIFDRLGNLLKSWLSDDQSNDRQNSSSSHKTGDADLDDSMAELDAFLNDDRETQEKLRLQKEERIRAEAESHARARGMRPQPALPQKLLDAYKVLGLAYGCDFALVKSSYKRLLKEHHPDKHGNSAEAQKKATATSARINDAYRVMEAWNEKGALGDE